MSKGRGPCAAVVGHAGFAAGVVSALEQITGLGGLLVPLSTEGMGPEEIEGMVKQCLTANGMTVVFSDLPSGSGTMAARRLLRSNPEMVLVTGANLPMLLDFVHHVEVDARSAAVASAERGRGGIAIQVGGAIVP